VFAWRLDYRDPRVDSIVVINRSYKIFNAPALGGPEYNSNDERRFNDRMRKAAVLAGTIGPILFGGVLIILTLMEFDFMRSLGWEPLGLSNTDWPSGLALGPHGHIMTAAFLINGLFVIFFAVGLPQALPSSRPSRAASILLLLAGVAMMGLASTTDPTIRTTPATLHGRIHDGCFVALGMTLFPSMLLFGWTFRRVRPWRSLSTYTWPAGQRHCPGLRNPTFEYFYFRAQIVGHTGRLLGLIVEQNDYRIALGGNSLETLAENGVSDRQAGVADFG